MSLEARLDAMGIRFNPNRDGNQPIQCPSMDHDDSTASASLNLGKRLWNCFACGAGGSEVDLIMEAEGKSLIEAMREAERNEQRSQGGPERSALGLPAKSRHPAERRSAAAPWAGFR